MNGREHDAPRIGFEGPGGFGISVDDVNMPLDRAHWSQSAGVVASAPPQLTRALIARRRFRTFPLTPLTGKFDPQLPVLNGAT